MTISCSIFSKKPGSAFRYSKGDQPSMKCFGNKDHKTLVFMVQTSILFNTHSSTCMQYVLVSVITYRVIVTYRHYCFYKYCKDSLDYCKCKPRNFRCQKDEKFFFITKQINLVTWEFSLTWPLSQNILTSLSFVDSFKLRYVCVPHNIYSARML